MSVAGTPVTTYVDGFPKAPPTPPALSAVLTVGSTTRVARFSCATGRDCVPPTFLRHAGLSSAVIVDQFHDSPSMHDSAARAPRGGRERRVSLRKPVVVRRDRRPADRTFRRTARRSDRVSEGPPVSPARRTGSQGSN